MFGWFRKSRPSEATPPVKDYWITVRVSLRAPLPVDGRAHMVGYFLNLGVRCAPETLREVVEREIHDGSVLWSESEHSEVVPHELSPDIVSRMTPVFVDGVWYKSGRVLFPADA